MDEKILSLIFPEIEYLTRQDPKDLVLKRIDFLRVLENKRKKMDKRYYEDGCEEDQIVKMIVPLRDVPNDSTVTKRTGTCLHTVVDKIRFYGSGKERKVNEVKAEEGVRFLVAKDNAGAISVLPGHVEVVWHAFLYEAREYLGCD